MSGSSIEGKWAVVTGASSGLGADFARELARRGCHVMLVARREERLQALAEELKRDHPGVESDIIPMDLGRCGAGRELHAAVRERDREVAVLVNNAGFGTFGPFLESSLERDTSMMHLNMVTLVELTKLFAQYMVRAGFGRILQVASIAAYQPTPVYALYSASKSFVLNFSEALGYELAGTGVRCTVLSPGVTATEFLEVAGQRSTSWYQRAVCTKSRTVARMGIEAMLKGRRSLVPGWHNWLITQSVRLIPRGMVLWFADLLMRTPDRND
jgi:hypothetical protein